MNILKFFLCFFAIIGVVFVILTIYILSIDRIELANKYAGFELNKFAKKYDDSMRSIAYNYTENCSTPYPNCYALNIYYNLKEIKYRPTSKYKYIYEPNYTYKYGGDCKNTAILYTSLMHSLGFDAFIDCDVNNMHCVSYVPNKPQYKDEYDQIIVVDLAAPSYRVLNGTITDYWSMQDYSWV